MPSKPEPAPHCELILRVHPRSSRNHVAPLEEGRAKVWITAPPVDGQANEAVLKLLAKKLALAPSRLTLLSGENARDKRIRVDSLTLSEAFSRLRQ